MTDRNEYLDCTDEQLILKIKQGETQVVDYLCEKYKNLVRSKAKSMFILGADRDDLIQEGMLGLFKAVRDYDSGRDASFYTFAELCISRQMYTAVQTSKRQKHVPLNTYISLDSAGLGAEEQDADSSAQLEVMTTKTEWNPEEMLLDKERVAFLQREMEQVLSEFERQALELYMTGMSYTQIAKVLGREEKATDNALTRAKQKVREIIKTDSR